MENFSVVAATGSYQFKINQSKTKDKPLGTWITSPKFGVGQHEWAIRYYPQGYDKNYSGRFVSFFWELPKLGGDISVTFAFALLDRHGNVSSATMQKFLYKFTPPNKCVGVPCFLERTILEENYIIEDCFVLDVLVTIRSITGRRFSHNDPFLGNYKFLHDRFQRLREENKQTDVSFIVDGKNFAAHRLILAAHSPVFEAELFGSMVESNIGCITISEMMPLEFKAMLDFMYTGSIPVYEELGDDEKVSFFQNLLAAADQYAVENLKSMCENKLVKSISFETVISLLELAEKHNCSELKNACLEFIVEKDNSVSVVFSEGYIKLMQKYPSLLDELKDMAGN